MKKMKLIMLSMISLFLVTGCGNIPTLQNGEEAVVSFENEHLISVDDLYTEIKDTYGLTALMNMMDKYILEDKYEDFVEEANEYVEQYMASMIQSYGSEEELLTALQQSSGYSSIEEFEESLYLNYLQTHAIEEYSKEQVSDDQVEKYYDEEVKSDLEVSHILIMSNTDSTETEDIEAAEEAARDEIEAIIADLNKAKEDGKDVAEEFASIAEEKSQDEATKTEGGSLGRINNYNSLSASYDELIEAAYELKDGEYSTEVIETELGFHVILRTKTYDKEPLEDIKEDLIEVIAEGLLQTDTQMSFDAIIAYREEYGMKIEDSELDKQYRDYVNSTISAINAPVEEETAVQ